MNDKRSKRRPIGRSLGRSVDLSTVSASSSEVIYELSSGRKVTFYRKTIAAADVSTLTYVHTMNKRNAEDLTRPSLELLINSIVRQQYQPVIAQEIDGHYATMDGSRRRQSAIYAGVGLELLYCKEALTKPEVKSLSKELQSAKEHSIRENGKVFAQLMQEQPELTQSDVAEQEGFTQSYVSKAIQAWEIPQTIINLYEYPSDITLVEFNKLSKVLNQLVLKAQSLESFIKTVTIPSGALNDEVTQIIIEHAGLNKPATKTNKPVKIVDVNAKKWAKVAKNKEKTTITFNRLTEEEYLKIEKYIQDVMKK
uniref:ParB/RepB/Spo0J family partition protein n=1 Tax=Shewanella gaetbuli TaxID=220752 RepID=UPI003B5B51FE